MRCGLLLSGFGRSFAKLEGQESKDGKQGIDLDVPG
jgi:hypothetical protein